MISILDLHVFLHVPISQYLYFRFLKMFQEKITDSPYNFVLEISETHDYVD
jgi:hypothetical protein